MTYDLQLVYIIYVTCYLTITVLYIYLALLDLLRRYIARLPAEVRVTSGIRDLPSYEDMVFRLPRVASTATIATMSPLPHHALPPSSAHNGVANGNGSPPFKGSPTPALPVFAGLPPATATSTATTSATNNTNTNSSNNDRSDVKPIDLLKQYVILHFSTFIFSLIIYTTVYRRVSFLRGELNKVQAVQQSHSHRALVGQQRLATLAGEIASLRMNTQQQRSFVG